MYVSVAYRNSLLESIESFLSSIIAGTSNFGNFVVKFIITHIFSSTDSLSPAIVELEFAYILCYLYGRSYVFASYVDQPFFLANNCDAQEHKLFD
jgi:hypothetical protein